MATATPLKPRFVPKRIGCHHNPKHKPAVNPEAMELSILNRDQAEWADEDKAKTRSARMTMVEETGKVVSGKVKFIIRFDKPEGSPFDASFFCVPEGGRIFSGNLRPEVKPKQRYAYTIEDMEGNTTDPEIDIMP